MIPSRAFAAVCLLLVCASSLAQNTNQDQPINVEADSVTVDDRLKIHTFEGNAVLTQGSLVIKGDKLVVIQTPDGFQTGTATAKGARLATFQQQRSDSSEMIEGKAERIEYNSRTELAKLFKRAHVKAGEDEIHGDYIEYDALTEKYRVTSDDNSDTRVKVTIQPKKPASP